MKVPFNDLRLQHAEVRDDIRAAVDRALDNSAFIGGAAVRQFEEHFAAYCGARHAIGVSNGTEALRVALHALDIGPGKAVVTVPNTFIATAEAVVLLGAQPVFVDVDPATYNMDPAALRAYLESATRRDPATGRPLDPATGAVIAAILPVHLYGFPADMQALHTIAAEFNLDVVEDAAQAHGSTYTLVNGAASTHKAGTTGRFGCFSMYPGKNLGAIGEAGAVITNDDALAARVRLLVNHGQSERYIHAVGNGTNGRLDAIQAAVLDIKLPHLDEWNHCRRQVAAHYAARLAGAPVITPQTKAYGTHIYHVYLVQVENRDQVRQQLAEAGVETGLHYPVPLHLQAAYRDMQRGPGDFPVTEEVARRLLSLPMFPHMTADQIDYVCDKLLQAVQ